MRAIGVAFLFVLAFGLAARALAASKLLVDVPLQRFDVTVNGQGPFVFGFDTGASGEVWVTRALVDEVRLPLVGHGAVSDGTGINSRTADRVRLGALTVGQLSFTGVIAPVLGDGSTRGGDAAKSGNLGFQLFRNYLVTLDFPAQRLRVTAGSLPKPDGKTILNYSLDRGSPLVAVQLGAVRVNAFIDSGSGGGIMLPRSFSTRLTLASPISPAGKVASALNEFDLYRANLDGHFELGALDIQRPAIFFSDLVQQPTIGRAVLRQAIMTFDQKRQRLQVQIP